jgi:hypothetical protein
VCAEKAEVVKPEARLALPWQVWRNGAFSGRFSG